MPTFRKTRSENNGAWNPKWQNSALSSLTDVYYLPGPQRLLSFQPLWRVWVLTDAIPFSSFINSIPSLQTHIKIIFLSRTQVWLFPLWSDFDVRCLQLFKDSHFPYNSLEITSILRQDLGPEEFSVHLTGQFCKRFNTRPVEHEVLNCFLWGRRSHTYPWGLTLDSWGNRILREPGPWSVVAWVPTGAPLLRAPTVRISPADTLSPVQIPWVFVNTFLI